MQKDEPDEASDIKIVSCSGAANDLHEESDSTAPSAPANEDVDAITRGKEGEQDEPVPGTSGYTRPWESPASSSPDRRVHYARKSFPPRSIDTEVSDQEQRVLDLKNDAHTDEGASDVGNGGDDRSSTVELSEDSQSNDSIDEVDEEVGMEVATVEEENGEDEGNSGGQDSAAQSGASDQDTGLAAHSPHHLYTFIDGLHISEPAAGPSSGIRMTRSATRSATRVIQCQEFLFFGLNESSLALDNAWIMHLPFTFQVATYSDEAIDNAIFGLLDPDNGEPQEQVELAELYSVTGLCLQLPLNFQFDLLPPPLPVAPQEGMTLYRGKWVWESQRNRMERMRRKINAKPTVRRSLRMAIIVTTKSRSNPYISTGTTTSPASPSPASHTSPRSRLSTTPTASSPVPSTDARTSTPGSGP